MCKNLRNYEKNININIKSTQFLTSRHKITPMGLYAVKINPSGGFGAVILKEKLKKKIKKNNTSNNHNLSMRYVMFCNPKNI